jgi:4'-phosphopantetheinyl transferase
MLDFNVSHSGRFALVAIAQRGAVGVDIEYRRTDLDVAALEPQMLSPLERQLGAHERPGFFEHWVAKEATLKAIGVGITEDLQHISVLKPAHAGDPCYRLQHSFKHWPAIGTWPLEAPSGYAAALAWTASRCTTQLQ